MTRDRPPVAETVTAIMDGKIDALFWVGGVPTPSITALAATPGKTIKLIDHGDGAENLRKTYGPIYVKHKILANAYPRNARHTPHLDPWHLLVVPDKPAATLVYPI